MARKRRLYTAEFRAEAVKLVIEQGLTRKRVAEDLGICRSVVASWVRKAQADPRTAAQPDVVDLAAEVAKLRKENAILREEREILKKATAFFAKEIR
jgi:transposase